MLLVKSTSLPDLTDVKTWPKLIKEKEEDIRFDSLSMREPGLKAIQDRLTKIAPCLKGKNIVAQDIVELSYLTYQAEFSTHRGNECLMWFERDPKMKSQLGASLNVGLRATKRLTYEISDALQLMFYSYLSPKEEFILSRLFKRIKSIIEKQRVWSITEEDIFQKQMVPAVEIRQTKGLYFCDLPEQVLTMLFCKGPLYRFELCSVVIEYGIFSKQPMLYGLIRAAESPVGQDGFVEVFNRKDNDPLVIPNSNSQIALLRNCFFSLPVSNPVQMLVKLHIKVDKVESDDDGSYTDDDGSCTDEDGSCTDDDGSCNDKVLTTVNDDDALAKDIKAVAEKMKAIMDEFADAEMGVLTDDSDLEDLSECDEVFDKLVESRLRREEELQMKNDNDEPFEVCNEYITIPDYLAKEHNGCVGSYRTKGKDASLELCYVTLKNTVEAALEVEFVGEGKKVVGEVMANYGKGFDYGGRAEKHLYNIMLFDRYFDNAFVIKPGKLNLTRSVLPVPAQFSLIISVYFHDINSESGPVMLQGMYEFLVPCDGSSSFASIVGNNCSINLKVNWKLPFDHMLSI